MMTGCSHFKIMCLCLPNLKISIHNIFDLPLLTLTSLQSKLMLSFILYGCWFGGGQELWGINDFVSDLRWNCIPTWYEICRKMLWHFSLVNIKISFWWCYVLQERRILVGPTSKFAILRKRMRWIFLMPMKFLATHT